LEVLVRVGKFLERTADGPEALTGPDAGQTAEPLHEAVLANVPTPLLRSLRDRLLGPLKDYDDRHNAELMTTLTAFLACDGSWSACASRMYVHVNTVRYRIGRIEALTGRDLSALPDQVDFFLALRGA
jgi:DNA-binding PucR family transcriptional regulator